MKDVTPVFVRGLSRSGGTLLCTMLDAHPKLAISYELYPNLLKLDSDKEQRIELLGRLIKALDSAKEMSKIPQERFPSAGYRTFFVRLQRGGITVSEAHDLLLEAKSKNLSFDLPDDCCSFVEMCCALKMHKERKRHWGAKMNNSIEQYLGAWPNARCIDIVRDVKDVAASQIKLGTFKKTAEKIAASWKQTHTRFLGYQRTHPANVKVIRYEDLIFDTENILRQLCEFIGIDYSDNMRNYQEQDLTLFNARHISRDKVMSGVNTSSIGQWKAILSDEQSSRISEVVGELAEYFEY